MDCRLFRHASRRLLSLAVLCLAASCPAHAATPRDAWVVDRIYAANHPYAADDLAVKMAKMRQGPFAFYRGTAHLFHADMAVLPPSASESVKTGSTWIGGDAHLGNFEAARDGNGTAVFHVADFDEGWLGQHTWDLRRLATSLVLAGRDNGLSDADIRLAIDAMVGAYVDAMTDFKGSSAESSFKLVKSNTTGVVDDTIAAADGKSRSGLLDKYTVVSGGRRVFRQLSDLVAVPSGAYAELSAAMPAYIASIAASKRRPAAFYEVKDIRRRLGAGAGSLGRLRYYVLIEGASTSGSDDVVLEFKQSVASAVAQAAPGRLPASAYTDNEGCRVARTAKAQLLDAEPLIGCTRAMALPFYVHEKSPYQEDFEPALLTSADKLQTAATYLGQALASAHAVSDQDHDAAVVPYSIDKQVIDALVGKRALKDETLVFAFDYAQQVAFDWAAFAAAYDAGSPLY